MRGHPRPPAALLAALLALVVLLAAGCANGSTDGANRYVEQVNAAQTDFARTVRKLNGRVTGTSSPRRDRATLRSFTRAVDAVVADLRRIDPPAPVASLHGRLVRDMEAYAGEVKSAASALRSRDAQRLIDSQQRLMKATSTVSGQINAAITAINRKLRG